MAFVDEIVLVVLAVGLNKLVRNELDFVSLFSQHGPHQVCSRAGFQADQRGTQVRGISQQLCPRELFADDYFCCVLPNATRWKRSCLIDSDGYDVHCYDPPDVKCRAILLGGGPSH